jgi:hypothetical protein
MIWPRGFVAAGAFWNFNASVDPGSAAFVQGVWALNEQLRARGSMTCPTNCSCDFLTACGQPYVRPTPPVAGGALNVQACDFGQAMNQQFLFDPSAARIRLFGNQSLCVATMGDQVRWRRSFHLVRMRRRRGLRPGWLQVYPARLTDCQDPTSAFTHDPATGHFVAQSNGDCLDVGEGAVGSWACGQNQSNQVRAPGPGVGVRG